MSMLIVSVMLVAALNTVGASRATARDTAERGRAALLAQDLMDEILEQQYEDPEFAPGSFGRNATEASTGDRSLFDDVDDYHGWSESPPEARDGTALAGFDGWERSVTVAWADPSNLNLSSGSDTRIKRITVTVKFNGRVLAEKVGLRTGYPVEADPETGLIGGVLKLLL